ncbi:MAG TPA: hypothetical protein VFM79_09550 [Pelobium sp.]|nr:hypothetical protein [Pelobium sp.]
MVVILENAEYSARHFNFDRMTAYLGNDKETIKKILLLVIKELKLSVKKFEEYIFNERLEDIKHTAQKLAKTTASVGLDRLCTLIRKLENLPSFDSNILNHYIYALKSEIRLAKKLINGYL